MFRQYRSPSETLARFPASSMHPLDLLCRWLAAADQGRPLDPAAAAALGAPEADLVGLARVAGRHCITPMLAACTSDTPLGERLPADFARYLEFVHAQNRRRNRALRLQLGQIS